MGPQATAKAGETFECLCCALSVVPFEGVMHAHIRPWQGGRNSFAGLLQPVIPTLCEGDLASEEDMSKVLKGHFLAHLRMQWDSKRRTKEVRQDMSIMRYLVCDVHALDIIVPEEWNDLILQFLSAFEE